MEFKLKDETEFTIGKEEVSDTDAILELVNLCALEIAIGVIRANRADKVWLSHEFCVSSIYDEPFSWERLLSDF